MEQFRLKKTRKRLFVSARALTAILSFGLVAFATGIILNSVNAEDEYMYGFDEDSFSFDVEESNYTEPEHYEYWLTEHTDYVSQQLGHTQAGIPIYEVEADENFPMRYDSTSSDDCQNTMGCVGKLENQRNENLCWAYSYTTAIESTIRNTLFEDNELSVKHLDYQLANNFSDNVTNPYWNYLYGDLSNNQQRTISGSANYQLASIVTTGKNTLVTEQSFWQKLQGIDNGLNGINSYAEYLGTNSSGYKNRISSDTVIDDSNAEYNLTSYETASNFIYYGENSAYDGSSKYYNREAIIRHFKNAIENYGAIGVNTHYNESKCGYVDTNNNLIIIDKSTKSNKKYCYNGIRSTAHAVSLVGWDDSIEYVNDGQVKNGAFIIQNSYGTQSRKEYLAYESAISGFFIATGVEKNNYDHVYDYTDQLGGYNTNSSKPANYQLEYSGPNNVSPAANELIFEFNTHGQNSEKLEKISFSERFKMAGNVYTAYLSTDAGASWQWLGNLQYFYSGMDSLDLSSKNIQVDGSFIIKIYSGKASRDGCVVEYAQEGSWKGKKVQKCTTELGQTVGLTAEPIDYVGEDFVDSEKKYDLVNVYTTDAYTGEETQNYTITFSTNNSDHISFSKNSVTVPEGSTFAVNKWDNSIKFIDSNNNVIDRVEASLDIEDEDLYTYSISWNYSDINNINSDIVILAELVKNPKTFRVIFQAEFENDSGAHTVLTYRDVGLKAGTMPVYKKVGPVINSSQEGMSYVFVGWEPEITPVVGDATYTAKFELVQDENGNGQGNQGSNEENPSGNGQGNQGSNGENPSGNGQGNQNSGQGGSAGGSPAVPNTDPENGSGTESSGSTNNGSSSSKQGSSVANTGYQTNEDNFIQADMFITAMVMCTIGFVIYIIKNRRHLRMTAT